MTLSLIASGLIFLILTPPQYAVSSITPFGVSSLPNKTLMLVFAYPLEKLVYNSQRTDIHNC